MQAASQDCRTTTCKVVYRTGTLHRHHQLFLQVHAPFSQIIASNLVCSSCDTVIEMPVRKISAYFCRGGFGLPSSAAQQQAAQQNRFAGSNMGVNLQPVRCHLFPPSSVCKRLHLKTLCTISLAEMAALHQHTLLMSRLCSLYAGLQHNYLQVVCAPFGSTAHLDCLLIPPHC